MPSLYLLIRNKTWRWLLRNNIWFNHQPVRVRVIPLSFKPNVTNTQDSVHPSPRLTPTASGVIVSKLKPEVGFWSQKKGSHACWRHGGVRSVFWDEKKTKQNSGLGEGVWKVISYNIIRGVCVFHFFLLSKDLSWSYIDELLVLGAWWFGFRFGIPRKWSRDWESLGISQTNPKPPSQLSELPFRSWVAESFGPRFLRVAKCDGTEMTNHKTNPKS